MLRPLIANGVIWIITTVYPVRVAPCQEWSWYLNHDLLNPSGVDAYGNNSAHLYDVDQDNDLDLVVGQGDGAIQLYYNDGFPDVERWRLDDTYFSELSLNCALVPSLGDFDGDDSLELVLGFNDEYGMPTDSLRVFRNRGGQENPRWEEVSAFFNISTQFHSYHKFIDWDGDGDFELILAVWEGWETPYLFFRNTGSPGDPAWSLDSAMTAAMPSDVTPCGIEGFDIADFNDDGFYDFLLSDFVCDGGSEILLYLNDGTNENPDFGENTSWIAYGEGYASNITTGDLDQDDDFDFFVGGAFPPVYYHRNNGNPQAPVFDGEGDQRLGAFYIHGGEDIALLDRDNDGDLDLAAVDSFWIALGGYDIVFLVTFDNYGSSTVPFLENANWLPWIYWYYTDIALASGDINGDGYPDLAFSLRGAMWLYRNVPGSRFEFDDSFFSGLEHPVEHPELVDIDLDEDLDLIAVDTTSNTLTAFENTGSPQMPQWSHRPEWVEGLDLSAIFACASNLNGDLLPDIVLEAGNHLKGYLNVGDNDDPSFQYVPEIFEDWQELDIGYFDIADLDGDFDDDIILDNSGIVLFLENQTRVDVEDAGKLPEGSFIISNYPNPFNSRTSIQFEVPEPGLTQIAIYDITGNCVRVLVDEFLEAGDHTIVWDGRNSSGQPVSSGVYFYRISVGDHTATKRMLLLK